MSTPEIADHYRMLERTRTRVEKNYPQMEKGRENKFIEQVQKYVVYTRLARFRGIPQEEHVEAYQKALDNLSDKDIFRIYTFNL